MMYRRNGSVITIKMEKGGSFDIFDLFEQNNITDRSTQIDLLAAISNYKEVKFNEEEN